MCVKHSIIQTITEQHVPKINLAESQGGISKRQIRNSMRKQTLQFAYGIIYMNIQSDPWWQHLIQDNGIAAFNPVLGYTLNISEFIQHKCFVTQK